MHTYAYFVKNLYSLVNLNFDVVIVNYFRNLLIFKKYIEDFGHLYKIDELFSISNHL